MVLDQRDRRILSLLQKDGSLSASEVAERIGMTPPPCWRRIRRLKDEGVLKKQVWLLDQQALGLEVTVYAAVRLTGHDDQLIAEFRQGVQSIPEVLECVIVLGNVDALLKIVIQDVRTYESIFYGKIAALPGVKEVNSSVVLSVVKSTLELPMDEPKANRPKAARKAPAQRIGASGPHRGTQYIV
jgi:Lrp/AsnC family transcriptional regulator